MYILLDKLTTTYRNVLARGNTPYTPIGEQIQDEIDPSEWPDTDNTDDVARDETTETYFIKAYSVLLAEYKRKILLMAQDLSFIIVNNFRYKIDYYNAKIALSITLTTEEQTEYDNFLGQIVSGVDYVRTKAGQIIAVDTGDFNTSKELIDSYYDEIYRKYLNKLESLEIVINGGGL